jgi:hypothetical protein
MCIACSPFGLVLGAAASRRVMLGQTVRLALGGAAMGFGLRFACSAAAAQAQPAAGVAEVIYAGGPIITMNDAAPAAEAVAIRGGRIIAVGSRAAVEAARGPGTRSINLDGRTLLPGFVDPHGHMTAVGLQSLSANLLPAPDGQANDIPAIQRIMREWIAANAGAVRRYGLVLGFGYDESQLREGRPPNRDELDQISTEVPVLIVHTSGHLGVVNTKALEAAGVTAATEDPTGGVYRRRAGSREPDGVLEELAFFAVLGKLVATLDQDAWRAMVRAGAEAYASFGYTTAQEGRAIGPLVATIAGVAERGLLPIDCVAYADATAAADVLGGPHHGAVYRNRFRVGGAKITIDGSVQGKTAWLTQPYLQPPPGLPADYRGLQTLPTDVTMQVVSRCFERGWQLLCHANGDAAIDLMIAAVREATARHGAADRRMVLIHGQTAREDQVEALRGLGVVPSLFTMHTYYWGDFHRSSTLGPPRAENISPTGWCMARDMRFTTHHDAPVAKPDSMRVLSSTVTRISRSGAVIGPQHRVPVATALKAMTIWPAWQHFEEATKGSIEVGKLADFVVLSDNPMTVDAGRLAGLKVMQTIKEGVAVFTA